jgi:hypothetical protein
MPRGSQSIDCGLDEPGCDKSEGYRAVDLSDTAFLAHCNLPNIRDRSHDQLIEPMPPFCDRGDKSGAGFGTDWARVGERGCRYGGNNLARPHRPLIGLLARVAGKRLELLLELVPAAKQIAYLRNPANPIFAESEAKEVTLAASTHGVRLLIADASSLSEIEKAFSDFTRQHVDALLVSSDGFFLTHPNQIVTLAAQNEIPAVYGWREAMTAGGLWCSKSQGLS